MARATCQRVGRRERVVYCATAKGRRALATWLAEPAAAPVPEFEALVRVFLTEPDGTEADVLTLLASAVTVP
ncbi:MAG: hypothetical protein ACRD29_16975 [Acidimicrobiales bacterium]